jgi:hypothetical protein
MAKSSKTLKPALLGPPDLRPTSTAPTQAEVEKMAYQIWLTEGQQPGCDRKNWFEAEKQLKTR